MPKTPTRARIIAIGLACLLIAAAVAWIRPGFGGRGKAELSVGAEATRFRVMTIDVAGAKSRTDLRAGLALLQQNKVDLVGFQGLRPAQYDSFKSAAGPTWADYGTTWGKAALSTTVAWRTDIWTLVSGSSLTTPQANGGAARRPYVLLLNRVTGRQVYLVNIDNAANRPGTKHPDQSAARAQATQLQATLVSQLHAGGTPVVLVGTPSEPTPSRYYCALTRTTPVATSAGGPAGPRTTCTPPARLGVEQIYATTDSALSNHTVLTTRTARTVATTPPLMSDVTLPALEQEDFQVASFNVLGANHTPKGNPGGYASGVTRMNGVIKILDTRGIDVVGFQELQAPQYDKFKSVVGSNWDLWPGAALGRRGEMHNSIAWRTADWEAVSKYTIKITYFGGNELRMPYVLLRNKATGLEYYFANFHNPADVHGDASRWRAEAKRREIALANQLVATGTPLILTGDMNERSTYFCSMTRGAPMAAAKGGSTGSGTCMPPPQPPIDWIFGSTKIRFTSYLQLRDTLVKQTTDHPVMIAGVALFDPPPAPTYARVATADVAGAQSRTDLRAALDLLRQNKVDLVGFQGLLPAQYDSLKAAAGTTWAAYPGSTFGKAALSTTIAWRTDTWTLVTASTLTTPVGNGGYARRPYVLLLNRTTGRQIYVIDIDNAADRPRNPQPDQTAARTAATQLQTSLINQLHADGTPVVLVGTPSDPNPGRYFCALTRITPVATSAGGAPGPRTTCSTPARLGLEQIYATTETTLSNHTVLTSSTARTIATTPPLVADLLVAPAG
jgi:endonuclease/exonuclease/phosphatase family metal-dependent hydrolase